MKGQMLFSRYALAIHDMDATLPNLDRR